MSRWTTERLAWAATGGLGIVPPLAVVALAMYLGASGAAAWRQLPLTELAGTTWLPLGRHFGILPLLLGTAASTALALLIALPIGLTAALYLTLYAGPRIRPVADSGIALLGSVPSIVVGLWGMTWIVPAVGNSLAAATLVLALMITPTFTLLAGAALRQVPADVPEAVRSLGVSEDIAAWTVVRHAGWGIFGAASLAATRSLGEAVAVSMVAGNVGAMPTLSGPVATLTSTLIVEFDGATGLHRSVLHLSALIVMALIAIISLLGRAMQRRR
ncbi:MAG: ABC transporter permease subunit [Acidobacteriota bacterium]